MYVCNNARHSALQYFLWGPTKPIAREATPGPAAPCSLPECLLSSHSRPRRKVRNLEPNLPLNYGGSLWSRNWSQRREGQAVASESKASRARQQMCPVSRLPEGEPEVEGREGLQPHGHLLLVLMELETGF